MSDNILKSLQHFTAIKEKYVDLAHSQWEDERHGFVQFEGVKFAQWEDQLKRELQHLKHEKSASAVHQHPLISRKRY